MYWGDEKLKVCGDCEAFNIMLSTDPTQIKTVGVCKNKDDKQPIWVCCAACEKFKRRNEDA